MAAIPGDTPKADPNSIFPAGAGDQQDQDYLLYSDRVALGGDNCPIDIQPAVIRIRGSILQDVCVMERAAFEAQAGRQRGRVVDLGNRFITPAFVNGHTHLPMVAFRGIGGLPSLRGNVIEDLYFRLETQLELEDIRAFARLGAYESLLSGVAVVHDHYYGGTAVAEALLDVGLCGVVSPTLQDLAGPGVPQLEAQLEATLAIRQESRYRDAGVVAALGPHATDTVSAGLWRRLIKVGEKYGLPLHFHVAQSFEELRRCHERNGCSPVEWLRQLGVLDSHCQLLMVHGIFASVSDLKLLDPSRHSLGFCPYSQVEYCFPADVRRWLSMGIPWMVGTDCANCNDSMNVQKELRLISGMHLLEVTHSAPYASFMQTGALPSAAAAAVERQRVFEELCTLRQVESLLSSVWSVPGRFHPQVQCGVIAPGKWAHLVIWDTEHPAFWPGNDLLRGLVYSDAAPAIDWMMVAGRFVGERGRFHSSIREDGAYRACCAEARTRLTRFLARWGG